MERILTASQERQLTADIAELEQLAKAASNFWWHAGMPFQQRQPIWQIKNQWFSKILLLPLPIIGRDLSHFDKYVQMDCTFLGVIYHSFSWDRWTYPKLDAVAGSFAGTHSDLSQHTRRWGPGGIPPRHDKTCGCPLNTLKELFIVLDSGGCIDKM